jgi:DNA-binding NarL/FixJ family response regulator
MKKVSRSAGLTGSSARAPQADDDSPDRRGVPGPDLGPASRAQLQEEGSRSPTTTADRVALFRLAGTEPLAIESGWGSGGAPWRLVEVPRQRVESAFPEPALQACALALVDQRLLAVRGFAWLGRWRQANSGLKVLLLRDVGDALNGHLTLLLLKARISGVLPTDTSPELCRKAICAVLAGELWFPRRILDEAVTMAITRLSTPDGDGLPGDVPRPHLAPREREILELLYHGLSNKEIARRLDISPETVKKYLAGLYRKSGISGRGRLVADWFG